MNPNLIVTIMAAGEGKRMNSNIPKVLHHFKGIPMLIRIIKEVLEINPVKIIIITGKYHILIKETIQNYIFNENYKKINFVQQVNPNGTGDAIKCTLNEYNDNDNVLILNGDMPLIQSNLLKKFVNDFSQAKLLVAKLDHPFGYGRILYDNNNKFIGIKEEKDCTELEKNINIINVGIYFFNSLILKKYIPLIDNNNIQNEYYLTDIVKILRNSKDYSDNNNINTYLLEDELKYQILGVNTQQELLDLENKY